MTTEARYGVWLHDRRIGSLNRKDDYTWFNFSPEYTDDPDRAVLGLIFEENLQTQHASSLRLPPWFSNLLPEGQLRTWIAHDRGVKVDREIELLAQVGRDLPGAVRVVPEDEPPEQLNEQPAKSHIGSTGEHNDGWRFSLAGVGLKFSMVRQGDRLTLPAYGQGGDWIVKLPDPTYPDVPLNEHAMMTLAQAAGINVPEHILIPHTKTENLPSSAWQSVEENAYAVKRFDRPGNQKLVHIEDFAQVRNIYPYNNGKYQGNFETIAALCYRGHDKSALYEFTRRLAFNILISNGDAHLKNWSLIYVDRKNPTLSPVYDLVSTEFYRLGESAENLGLKFHKTRRFSQPSLSSFDRLQRKVGARNVDLRNCVTETVERVNAAWPQVGELLKGNQSLHDSITDSIKRHSKTLLRE